ncbi:MAG: dipicolinate synthase subunit B [Clostridia bacterium]|nr:dipicolinate synthase subunit B [Clostridia bacterium]
MNDDIRLNNLTIGFAMCGSYCTFQKAFTGLSGLLSAGCSVVPIMSESAYSTDTRFGSAADHVKRLEEACGRKVIHTVSEAEPIGPKKLLDALVVAPCTGNTLAKLSCGVTDTSVTMAAKAQLRNRRPVIIAPSTNDALSANLKNIGVLMNTKNVYFVPFGQDDPVLKETSLVSDFSKLPEAVNMALSGRQIQPVLL